MSPKDKIIVSSSVANFKDKIMKKGIKWPGTLFIGLYHSMDYLRFIFTRGDKTIFFCGSDILNLQESFFRFFLKIRNKKYDYLCENEIEQDALEKMGIYAIIHPAFFGNVDDFPISYKWSATPHIWMCVHKGREKEYGMYEAIRLADKNPNITLHIYGGDRVGKSGNIVFHGQVPEEVMDKEIKGYQASIRFNKFDGFSEVSAKAALLGQAVFSRIYYPYTTQFNTLEELNSLVNLEKNNVGFFSSNQRDYWYNKLKEF